MKCPHRGTSQWWQRQGKKLEPHTTMHSDRSASYREEAGGGTMVRKGFPQAERLGRQACKRPAGPSPTVHCCLWPSMGQEWGEEEAETRGVGDIFRKRKENRAEWGDLVIVAFLGEEI